MRAIELGRMPDRLVNREPEMRRMQHEIVAPDIDRLRRELLHRFCAHSAALPGMSSDSMYSQPWLRGAKLLGETLRIRRRHRGRAQRTLPIG